MNIQQAGKTTYYARLGAIIELAGAKSHSSVEELIGSVLKRSPPNFVFHRRWDAKRKEMVPYCSEGAVRSAVALAADLGLMDRDSGALTELGAAAANPDKFDVVLRKQIKHYLDSVGCPTTDIESASVGMLRKTQLVLPTADELYSYLSEKGRIAVHFHRFRMLVRLLASCGGLQVCRRHIFLPAEATSTARQRRRWPTPAAETALR